MIIKEDNLKFIDNLITKKMKRGFWTGLWAFVLAKITHLLVTFAIGLFVVMVVGVSKASIAFLKIVDSPIVGIIYLLVVTRYIYLKLVGDEGEDKNE